MAMADINKETTFNVRTARGEFIEPADTVSAVPDPSLNQESEFTRAEPNTGESLLYADLVKNQLVSDTGGHKVVASTSTENLVPNAVSAQASANYASESALLQANLQKEAQHE